MEANLSKKVETEETAELRNVIQALRHKISVLEEKMAILLIRSVGRNPLPEDLNNLIIELADQRRAAQQDEIDSKISDKVNQLIQLLIEKSDTMNLKEIANLMAAKIKDSFQYHLKSLTRNYELQLTQEVTKSFDDFQKNTVQELKAEKETEINRIKAMVVEQINEQCPSANAEDVNKKVNESLNICLRNIEKEAKNIRVCNLNEISQMMETTLKSFLKHEISEKSQTFKTELSQIAFKKIEEKCHKDIEELQTSLTKYQDEINEHRKAFLMKSMHEELHMRLEEYKGTLRQELVEMVHSNSISMRAELEESMKQNLSSLIEAEMTDINTELTAFYHRELEKAVRANAEQNRCEDQDDDQDKCEGQDDDQDRCEDQDDDSAT